MTQTNNKSGSAKYYKTNIFFIIKNIIGFLMYNFTKHSEKGLPFIQAPCYKTQCFYHHTHYRVDKSLKKIHKGLSQQRAVNNLSIV